MTYRGYTTHLIVGDNREVYEVLCGTKDQRDKFGLLTFNVTKAKNQVTCRLCIDRMKQEEEAANLASTNKLKRLLSEVKI